MKKIIFFQLVLPCLLGTAQKPLTASFTGGIIYSRASFPGHPLNDTLKKLDYESGDFLDQHHVIQAFKKHQETAMIAPPK